MVDRFDSWLQRRCICIHTECKCTHKIVTELQGVDYFILVYVISMTVVALSCVMLCDCGAACSSWLVFLYVLYDHIIVWLWSFVIVLMCVVFQADGGGGWVERQWQFWPQIPNIYRRGLSLSYTHTHVQMTAVHFRLRHTRLRFHAHRNLYVFKY